MLFPRILLLGIYKVLIIVQLINFFPEKDKRNANGFSLKKNAFLQ